MSSFKAVARLADVPPGRACVVVLDDRPVALFNVHGTLCAIENECPHLEGPLGEGTLDGQVVTCPWHGWQFDVTTGACRGRPGITVARYEVRVEGDDILLAPSSARGLT